MSAPPVESPPCRGIILAHNDRKQYFREKDYHRWAAFCGQVCQCNKIDLLAWGRIPVGLLSTIAYVREFDGVVSLRTDGTAPPDGLEMVAKEGLGDVFLCPPSMAHVHLPRWLEACSRLALPVRLQLQMPRIADVACAERLIASLPGSGVRMVTVVLEDSFQSVSSCQTSEEGRQVIDFCTMLAELLPQQGVELRLVGLPSRWLAPSATPYAVSTRGYRYTHHNYDRQALIFAQRLFTMSPMIGRSLLLLALKRHTVSLNVTDRWLTENLYIHSTLLHNAYMYAAKRWRAWRGTPLARAQHFPEGAVFQSLEVGALRWAEQERAVRLLCLDGCNPPEYATAVPRDVPQPRYYDRFDEEQQGQAVLWDVLAREARAVERTTPPSRVFTEDEWATYEAFVIPEYGATAWLTSLSGKRVSTPIDTMNPPFMVMVTVGGGMAELVGFQLTPSCKILCPMVETRHTLMLYVRGDGRYVFLRDGIPVAPVAIPGEYPAPRRAPCVVRLFFIAWDIEDRITFSPLRLWREPSPIQDPPTAPTYSVVIFCTRFARRLSSVLQCLAHQTDFALSKLEVIVGYVPGLDATEDVLDSLRLTHPELRVVHATFPRQNLRSKGYVLNQCMDMASGSRILLLDADTLLPPTLFAVLEGVVGEHPFVFPRGRAMLGPELTAKILQGDVRPWDCWETLVRSADEVRENEALGVPIGYFQCFGRDCLEKVRYPEYEHFQGADYEFALGLRNYYGKEYRLDFPVLHLDHAGSQWLGAERHF